MRLEEHQRHKSDLQAQLSGQGGILRARDQSCQSRNSLPGPFYDFHFYFMKEFLTERKGETMIFSSVHAAGMVTKKYLHIKWLKYLL